MNLVRFFPLKKRLKFLKKSFYNSYTVTEPPPYFFNEAVSLLGRNKIVI